MFKRRLGEILEDTSVRDVVNHGSVSGAESPQAAGSWRLGESFREVLCFACRLHVPFCGPNQTVCVLQMCSPSLRMVAER